MTPARLRSEHSILKSERGAALLAALCFALVFIICLSSYIALCYTSLKMSTRNVMGAHAIELAEAGTEFALYCQNQYSANPTTYNWPGWYTSPASNGYASATTTMNSSGLVLSANNPAAMNLGNGMNGTVTLTVTGTATTSPVFTSSASVTLPNNGDAVTRTITTTGGALPIFVNAIAVPPATVASGSGIVTIKNSGFIDSYDSRLGTYSSQNPSLTPGALGSSAVILAQNNPNGSVSQSVRLYNTTLFGFAVGFDSNSPLTTNWCSPTTGKVLGPSTLNGVNIDPTRVITNPIPYQPVFPISIPPSSVLNPIPPANCSNGDGVLDQGPPLGNPASTIPTVYYGNGVSLSLGHRYNSRTRYPHFIWGFGYFGHWRNSASISCASAWRCVADDHF